MKHPECKCGNLVEAHEYMRPSYDDGGSVDSFSPEIEYLDECGDCMYYQDTNPEDFRDASTDPIKDELPF